MTNEQTTNLAVLGIILVLVVIVCVRYGFPKRKAIAPSILIGLGLVAIDVTSGWIAQENILDILLLRKVGLDTILVVAGYSLLLSSLLGLFRPST